MSDSELETARKAAIYAWARKLKQRALINEMICNRIMLLLEKDNLEDIAELSTANSILLTED